jgi:hypothetical protein
MTLAKLSICLPGGEIQRQLRNHEAEMMALATDARGSA